jgi:chitin synthase
MMQDDARTDLTSLYSQEGQTPSDDSISNLLCNRFKRNLPYTQLGYSHLVVVNPYQYLELQNDATLKSYAEYCYKDLSEKKPRLQPHIYEFATRIYFHMRRTGEDQSIIMRYIYFSIIPND